MEIKIFMKLSWINTQNQLLNMSLKFYRIFYLKKPFYNLLGTRGIPFFSFFFFSIFKDSQTKFYENVKSFTISKVLRWELQHLFFLILSRDNDTIINLN